MPTLPKIGDPIPNSNLKYEAEDIANLANGSLEGTMAVVTSAGPATKTTQNVAELTTATAPKQPVPAYGSDVVDAQGRVIGVAKYDPNTGRPLTNPNAEVEKAALDAANKKQAEIDKAIQKWPLSYRSFAWQSGGFIRAHRRQVSRYPDHRVDNARLANRHAFGVEEDSSPSLSSCRKDTVLLLR